MPDDHDALGELLAVSRTMVLMIDRDLVVVAASESFRSTFLGSRDPVGVAVPDLIARHRRAPLFDTLFTAVHCRALGSAISVLCSSGFEQDQRWFDVAARPVVDSTTDEVTSVLLEVHEITAVVSVARRTVNPALIDHLTGGLTRAGVVDWLQQRLGADAVARHCVCTLQIDQFDVVEQALGDSGADELLQHLAANLSARVPHDGTIARTGRATFCVVFPATGDGEADDLSVALRDAARQPVTASGRTFRLTASVGSSFADQRSPADRALRDAEAAVLEARRRGGNRYAPFVGLHPEEDRFMGRWEALRDALRFRQMEVWYQPIVSLADDRPLAAEALSRWHHPHLGEISPAEFIPLAEWGAEIFQLGHFVHERVIETMSRLRSTHDLPLGDFQMSINTSTNELTSHQFATGLLARIKDARSLPEWYALEIDDAALAEDDATVRTNLSVLAAAGVVVTLGDFGSGSASMARLLEVPVRRVKIARRFVAAMTDDQVAQRVISSLVVMAREAGIQVVAEGVETVAQRRLLVELGCQAGQGYLFAPAVPVTELADLLRDLAGRRIG